MKDLNARQKTLYKWLLFGAEASPHRYWSKETICTSLSDYYARHQENTSEHNSVVFCQLRKDVRAINFSGVEKIIVSNHEGYKIATQEEAERYVKRRLKSSLVSLKLYWNIKRKMNQNGQLDMTLHEVESYVGGKNE